jgi:hypothetical protein
LRFEVFRLSRLLGPYRNLLNEVGIDGFGSRADMFEEVETGGPPGES